MSLPVPNSPGAVVGKRAKIAGLLGSDQDGERSAAAHRATLMLHEAGLTWRQVIEAAGPRRPEPDAGNPSESHWREKLQDIDQHSECLTGWASDFVLSIMGHGRKWQPSPKQHAVIDRIHRKVMAS